MYQNEKNYPLTADLREYILSELPCGLCVARDDERLGILFANDNYYRMIGFYNADQASEYGLRGALDYVEAETRAEILSQIAGLSDGQEQAIALEARILRRDGSATWAIIHASRIKSDTSLWICAFMDITPQKRVEEELRVREEEYRIAVRQSDKLVLRYHLAEKTAYLPPESAELFQRSVIENLPEFLNQNNVINPESLEASRELFSRIVSGEQPTGSAVLQLNLSCDLVEFEWYRVTYSLIYDEEHVPTQAVISLQNVTEQHAREVAYRRWEKTYESLPQQNTAFLEFDLTQGRLEAQKGTLLSPLPEQLSGSMESAMRHFLSVYVHPEDRERIRPFTAREHLLTEYFRGARLEKQEYRHLKENGKYVWVRLSVQMLPDPYSSNVRASILLRDVDVQKREELTMMNQLRTDMLTGVLNRGAFLDAAQSVFLQPLNGGLHALVMVDVDHFKRINDKYGHGYGDRVLARICDLLRNALRADDLVGRIGGDEFVLLLKNVVNREALQAKINNLCAQLYQDVSDKMEISCSFGAATYPQDGSGFDELYRKADTALYAAKEAGRNCTRIYQPDMGRTMPFFELA
ncbi:MAG: diguanylate cyclase [Eubacteriales bacterium]|nr:diguanylate cyclase [Eubacteriales bacterium]